MVRLLMKFDVHDTRTGENPNGDSFNRRFSCQSRSKTIEMSSETRCERWGPLDRPLNGEIGNHIGGLSVVSRARETKGVDRCQFQIAVRVSGITAFRNRKNYGVSTRSRRENVWGRRGKREANSGEHILRATGGNTVQIGWFGNIRKTQCMADLPTVNIRQKKRDNGRGRSRKNRKMR